MRRLIPDFYITPLGLPLYWMNEQSGVLKKAVDAHHNFILGEGPEPDENTVSLLREYLDHFIFAPCWTHNSAGGFEEELAKLRKDVKTIRTTVDIRAWIHEAMDIGLDPF